MKTTGSPLRFLSFLLPYRWFHHRCTCRASAVKASNESSGYGRKKRRRQRRSTMTMIGKSFVPIASRITKTVTRRTPAGRRVATADAFLATLRVVAPRPLQSAARDAAAGASPRQGVNSGFPRSLRAPPAPWPFSIFPPFLPPFPLSSSFPPSLSSPLLSSLLFSTLLYSSLLFSSLVENVAENVERETNCPDILDSISRPLASHCRADEGVIAARLLLDHWCNLRSNLKSARISLVWRCLATSRENCRDSKRF